MCILLVQVACPVCRVPLSQADVDTIMSCPRNDLGAGAVARTEAIVLSEDVRREQERRARLFAEQKNKGGIIDLEAERSKYLLPAVIISRLSSCSICFDRLISICRLVNSGRIYI